MRGGIGFGCRDLRGKAKGDIVKTQEEHIRTAGGSDHRSDEATEISVGHPAFDRDAIGRLAYFYWEERGCPNDSPDEDWLRAEAELRNRLAAAASHKNHC
jgi:hypothetical protein